MHPRWSGWLQRKEDSQPKQYYFWQWIIRLAHQPAMIFTVIRFTQVLFFFFLFLLFLGCPERQREGLTDGWIAATKIIQRILQSISGNTIFTRKNLLKGKGQGSPTTSVSRKTRPGCGQYWQDESPPSHPRSPLKGKISTLSSSSSSSSLTAAQIVLTVS